MKEITINGKPYEVKFTVGSLEFLQDELQDKRARLLADEVYSFVEAIEKNKEAGQWEFDLKRFKILLRAGLLHADIGTSAIDKYINQLDDMMEIIEILQALSESAGRMFIKVAERVKDKEKN